MKNFMDLVLEVGDNLTKNALNRAFKMGYDLAKQGGGEPYSGFDLNETEFHYRLASERLAGFREFYGD